jgi:hypothetical protein
VTVPLFRLSNVNPKKLSICTKGANGKTFFLRKQDGDEPTGEHVERALFVKSDWSKVYCVVAEPGAIESGGVGADPDTRDTWTADEIEKACHQFAKNGGEINLNHGDDFGGVLVENAIAQSTFTVDGPDGAKHKIKKGSWYVAIEPDAKLRKGIEDGEITGVSLEGTGLRTLVKTHAGESRGKPLSNLIRHYLKKPHPFTSCVRDNRKRFGPRTEAVCAGLKDVALGTHRWRAQFKKEEIDTLLKANAIPDALMEECSTAWAKHGLTDDDARSAYAAVRDAEGKRTKMRKLLERLAKGAGVPDDEIAEALADDELAKSIPTFDELMAQRELEKELPESFNVLRSVVWRAFYPSEDDDVRDVKKIVGTSMDQMKARLVALASRVEVRKGEGATDAEIAEELRKELGEPPAETGDRATVGANADGNDSGDLVNDAERKQIVDETTEAVVTKLTAAPDGKDESEAPLTKAVAAAIKPLGDKIAKLEEHGEKTGDESGDGTSGEQNGGTGAATANGGSNVDTTELTKKADELLIAAATIQKQIADADGGSSQDDSSDTIQKSEAHEKDWIFA